MTYETPEFPSQTVENFVVQLPDNVTRAVRVWLSLTDAEKDELRKAIRLCDNLPDPGKASQKYLKF